MEDFLGSANSYKTKKQSYKQYLFKQKTLYMHISELPDSDAGVVPDTFAMRFSRV